jgi:hypothetical protein
MSSQVEMVGAAYIADKCEFSQAHAYRYMKTKGVHPTRVLGIYHYPKDKVDAALVGYMIKPRKEQVKKESWFRFDDFQMTVMRFCRGDYTNKAAKPLAPSQNATTTTVHLKERNDFIPPHSGLTITGYSGSDYRLLL